MRYACLVGFRPSNIDLAIKRAELRNKLNQQVAEMNTLKSLPIALPVPHSKSTGKAGQDVRNYLFRM